VMTDWFGGDNAVAQLKAGNDLLMPGTSTQVKSLADATSNGSLDVQVLDENVGRILTLIIGSQTYKNYAASNAPNLKANAIIARTAATEGMVLLKNETNTLPLSKNIKSIATFGNSSYDFISGGTGSGDVNEAYTISLEQGLSNAGYMVNDFLKKTYIDYITDYKGKHPKKSFMEEFFSPTPPIPEYVLNVETIAKTETTADVALITIGRNSGEGSDRKKENDFNLNEVEKTLIKNVANAFHSKGKKVFVVLNIGGVIEMASWRNEVDAILLTWQGGQEAGNAVADVLSGKVNPSGKLATTFPIAYDDHPSAKNFPGKNLSTEMKKGPGGMPLGFESEVVYEEGIYVGYRYFNSYHVQTAYPFGFGLSYTKFAYTNLKLSAKQFNGKIMATVEVKNVGTVAGKEAVQLYVSAPAKNLQKPEMELKAFGKTNLLQPGQKQVLQFELNAKDLASFDTPSSSWLAESGNYVVKIGASADHILQTASFSVAKQLMVEKCENALKPVSEINEMKH
jgi:beta-glucosidase